MGLDIYLYRYENFQDTERREHIYDKESSLYWEKFEKETGKKYDEMTQEEKDKISEMEEKLAKRLNLDRWGEDVALKKEVEIDYEKYPEHYFKIGYFRSSYNESGINRKFHNLGLPVLDEIFRHEGEEDYCFRPIWESCLERLKGVYDELQKIISNGENYGVAVEDYNEFQGSPNDHPIKSSEDALKTFIEEKRRHCGDKSQKDVMPNYSSSKGEFYFGKPLEVVGVISGVKKRLFVDEHLPCQYLIYKDDSLDWYLQAVEIMKATVEYVLAQSDKEKYYLHWSS
jgi:hypothetical protein